jgi:tRNA(fMet)-specific endonuclease VapC
VPRYLLDTNVLSEPMRKRPDARVMRRLRVAPASALHTSVVCVMELRYGAVRRASRKLWPKIEEQILARVAILPLGEPEAIAAGDLLARLERDGEPIGADDLWIAATALVGGLRLVTRNVRHFARIDGLHVESWWDADVG